jgi:tryprostatin B 6-hydroxylase
MDHLPFTLSLCLGLQAGVVAHHGVFIHGEWHLKAPQLLFIHIGGLLCLYLLKNSSPSTYSSTVHSLISAFYSYLASLFLSMAIYRSFFHRLHQFPGPWCARISKLWHIWAARDAKNHLLLDCLHKKYGDFVRTGTLTLDIGS